MGYGFNHEVSMQNELSASTGNSNDVDYHAYLSRIQQRFIERVGGHLFTTDAEGLWDAYLAAMPDDLRQYHNCSACRRFVHDFGGLVTIGEDGRTEPAMWSADDACGEYLPGVLAMLKIVRRAKVTGVFLSSDSVWGQPETGVWRHWAITPPTSMIFRRSTQTARQAMAERKEDFKNLLVALNEFTLPVIDQALTLLETDSLYRSEKVLGQAQFLKNLHQARDTAPRGLKTNALWRLIAAAPAGFCHPRASMIGTLLEDIAAGKDFAEVSRSFKAKMHPLLYQRPQAAPTAGAIAQAEKIVEQLGAAGALRRRFARIEDIRALWTPKPVAPLPAKGGVFGHLQAKGETQPQAMAVPAQTMTWAKFRDTVLPTAERIEIYCGTGSESWCGLVTAADPSAPPILQWDDPQERNPVSWYFWHGGSTAEAYSLQGGRYHDLEAVALKPSMWAGEGKYAHQSQGVLFVVAGARETRNAGSALFPEILKAEFHGIRSVLEAYSRKAEIEGLKEPHVAGIMLGKGERWSTRLRVTAGGRVLEYTLDRWD